MTTSPLLPALIVLATLAQAPAATAREAHCAVPMADWQPREAVQAAVEKQGLTVRRIKIDDGCYEVDALDAAGQGLWMRLDPGSLAVLRAKSRDERHGEDDDDDHGRKPFDHDH